ncbi:hypothetical protein AYO21_08520 [Fonsecaea monophora]|uniref:Uncharacterized protein n=1 Tax=Fonsecaea monophora TaxID=254056 RepID=A0A177F0U0_9EURO|nr:hypothetical protein AYO21_08520 [Fonsecaea monophora]KAH0844592.1 hypothetical protein FOPE_09728 [Fonsecaea pedrosoi]OAG37221.1 hypothetical protein AYO21_08520 [Fonsecaea monophora]
MSDTQPLIVRKRSTSPDPRSQDGFTGNATIQPPAQEDSLLSKLHSLVAARTKLPILVGLLLICLPTVYLYSRETSRDHQKRTDTSILVWTFILGGTVGITVAMLAQSVLAYLLAVLCFSGHTNAVVYLAETVKTEDDIIDEAHWKRRREMSHRPAYWVFMMLFAFVVAGLVEESIKYIAITTMLGWAQRSSHGAGDVINDRDYMTVAVAAALGFATVENMTFLAGAARQRKDSGGSGSSAGGGAIALLTAVERAVIGTPGHCMTAAMIGANMLVRARHDSLGKGGQHSTLASILTTWSILRDPVLFHGCFNFMLFAVSALEGNVGWIHPRGWRTVCFVLVVAVSLQATLALVLRAKLREAGLL